MWQSCSVLIDKMSMSVPHWYQPILMQCVSFHTDKLYQWYQLDTNIQSSFHRQWAQPHVCIDDQVLDGAN